MLGDLPLALAQAATYLQSHGDISIPSYLQRYRDQATSGHVLAAGMDGYPYSVATTWLIHFNELARDPAALQLLQLCACLDPDRIDVTQLLSRPDVLSRPPTRALAHAAARADLFGALVDQLTRTGLVVRYDGDTVVRMHRLVAQVTREQVGGGQRRNGRLRIRWEQHVCRLLEQFFPADPREPVNWPTCAQLLAHVTVVAGRAEQHGAADTITAKLLARLGSYLSARGEYRGGNRGVPPGTDHL